MWKDKVRIIRDYIIKHGKVIFPVIVIAAVAVTATIAMNAGDTKGEEILNGVSDGDAAIEEVALNQPVEEVPLVPNEDGAIYTLIATYYNAMALGDKDTLNDICDEISDQDMLRYMETSKYIESYPALEIYTKKGPEEGSTIAYVYYKVVFTNHEEQLPGYKTHYICTDENGELYIRRGENSDSVNEYIQRVSSQDDVIEFNNRITVEYNEMLEAHPELWEYLDELDIAVSTAVGEILAEQVAAENETANENAESTDEASGASDANTETEQPPQETPAENVVQYATTTETVNVRSSDSEQAEKMGKATQGTTLQVVEQLVNGWTKVLFDGKEGFIKSEYLQLVENADGATVIGTVTATTNINVRASASEDAERLGVLAGGDSVELLANENGWCKINYNGRVAYVKSDYVQ